MNCLTIRALLAVIMGLVNASFGEAQNKAFVNGVAKFCSIFSDEDWNNNVYIYIYILTVYFINDRVFTLCWLCSFTYAVLVISRFDDAIFFVF